MDSGGEALRFDNVGKAYGAVRALENVTFGVRWGSVHALLGENGAGKSTLLKALSGAHLPTEGSIVLKGTPRVFRSPGEAIAAGVAVIYQELHLVPEMSVEENLLLGRLPATLGIVKSREVRARARQMLADLDDTIPPNRAVSRLSIGQRQMVEIAKALGRGAKVIAFDEPTSSLSSRESERLFAVIDRLRKSGCAVMYVSHRLEEVFRLCDAATVLRDGRYVCTHDPLGKVTQDEVVRSMVGREIRDVFGFVPRQAGEPVLEVDRIEGPGLAAPASLSVRAGEIVGLFGLVGAGRSELLRLIYGAERRRGGRVRVSGKPLGGRAAPRASIHSGLMLCPEDRKRDGIVPVLAVRENINISARRSAAALGFVINSRWEQKNAEAQVRAMAIRIASLRQPVRDLSGGNQQKAILGRWLSEKVRVLLLDEPTRGIDVGSKAEIYRLINELALQRKAVLMVSSYLPELLGVCDRVAVMCRGHLHPARCVEEIDEHQIMQEATGTL